MAQDELNEGLLLETTITFDECDGRPTVPTQVYSRAHTLPSPAPRECHETSSCCVSNRQFPFERSRVKLGKGGSGTVWLGRCQDTHNLVAIKRKFIAGRGRSDTPKLHAEM